MKVAVLVKATKDSEAGVMPTPELLAAMGQFNESLVKAGILLAGEGLKPSRLGKRVHFSGKQRTVIRIQILHRRHRHCLPGRHRAVARSELSV